MTLSVIVPAYNIEKYLRDCILSILSQSYTDYELIIVNDGSTDETSRIAHEMESIDNRVRVIDQPNAGPSGARNAGIYVSKGEWLTFVDGDDLLPEDSLLLRMNRLSDDVDIVIGRTFCFFSDSDERFLDDDDFDGSLENLSGTEAFSVLSSKVNAPLWAVWRSIYRKSLFTDNNLYFKDGILSEDLELIPRIFMRARGISFCRRPVYLYRRNRQGSIMTSFNLKRETDLAEILREYLCIFDEAPELRYEIGAFINTLGTLGFCVMWHLMSYSAEERKIIVNSYLPVRDMILGCTSAHKWKFIAKILGAKQTFYIIAKYYKGKLNVTDRPKNKK